MTTLTDGERLERLLKALDDQIAYYKQIKVDMSTGSTVTLLEHIRKLA